MEGFLTFIFIAVVVIWLLGLVGRVALRWWIGKKQRQFAQQFGHGAGAERSTWGRQGSRSRDTDHREGEVRVERTEAVEKKVSKNVGDYVEFEEVEITEETE